MKLETIRVLCPHCSTEYDADVFMRDVNDEVLATIERLEAENAALQRRIGECEGALQVQENMTAALRARLDDCGAALMADAEGR